MMGTLLVALADLPREGEAVLLGHHHVEDADVEVAGLEGARALGAVLGESDIVVVHLEVGAQDFAEVLFVLDE